MTHQTKPVERTVEATDLPIVTDPSYIGHDVYAITDLDLLIEWWKAGQWLDSSNDNSFKIKQLRDFYASVWIQINRLHSKTLLRFRDIE